MKSVDQDDLETLGLDAEAAARLIGASRREVGELLFYKPQGFGFIRPLGETDRKKNIMAHRSAFSHPSVPLRLPPSSLVAYALGSHNGATVAREVRPLDASQAPVLEPDPPAAVVTPPASPPKKEPDVSETTPSAPQIPTVKRNESFGTLSADGIVGPYGYGGVARDDDRHADPVFTLLLIPWRRRRRAGRILSARSWRPSGHHQQPYSRRRRRPYNKQITPRSARAASIRAATRHWCPAAMCCAAGASRRTSNATTPACARLPRARAPRRAHIRPRGAPGGGGGRISSAPIPEPPRDDQ